MKIQNQFFTLLQRPDRHHHTALKHLPEKKLKNKGTYLANVKVDSNGKLTKSLLYIEEDDYDIRPRQFESVSENLIVYHVRSDRKNTKILRIQVK